LDCATLSRFRPKLLDGCASGRTQLNHAESALRAVRKQQHLLEFGEHVVGRINRRYDLPDGICRSVKSYFTFMDGGQVLALHNLYRGPFSHATLPIQQEGTPRLGRT
jgi:hypothetical protein